eukprot:maker-scaffold_10-augustus-gene-11.9-mRNA-1 protein AED:0.90 eAED:0.90 QI:0/0/0/0.5/1/1/2/0/765
MTGFLSDGDNPISIMTLKSLLDLGYVVNLDAREDYQIPGVELPDNEEEVETETPTFSPTESTTSPSSRPTSSPEEEAVETPNPTESTLSPSFRPTSSPEEDFVTPSPVPDVEEYEFVSNIPTAAPTSGINMGNDTRKTDGKLPELDFLEDGVLSFVVGIVCGKIMNNVDLVKLSELLNGGKHEGLGVRGYVTSSEVSQISFADDEIEDIAKDVSVKDLDFNFVNQCEDIKYLRKIMILLTTKHKYYPELLKKTEKRFISLLSPKEKAFFLAKRKGTSMEEKKLADQEIYEFVEDISEFDGYERVEHIEEKNSKSDIFEEKAIKVMEVQDIPKLEKTSKQRTVISETFVEKQLKLFKKSVKNVNLNNPRIVLELVEREKQKGNESFKEQDYEMADLCYSKAIEVGNLYKGKRLKLNHALSRAYANRAEVRLRQKRYRLVAPDCSQALQLVTETVDDILLSAKVIVRKAKALEAIGSYEEAVDNLEQSLLKYNFVNLKRNGKYEKNSRAILNMLGRLRAKLPPNPQTVSPVDIEETQPEDSEETKLSDSSEFVVVESDLEVLAKQFEEEKDETKAATILERIQEIVANDKNSVTENEDKINCRKSMTYGNIPSKEPEKLKTATSPATKISLNEFLKKSGSSLPQTSSQFEVLWPALCDVEKAQLIFVLSEKNLIQQIFSVEIQENVLIEIIESCNTYARTTKDDKLAGKLCLLMKKISQIPRFNTLIEFLEPKFKKMLKSLINELNCGDRVEIQQILKRFNLEEATL